MNGFVYIISLKMKEKINSRLQLSTLFNWEKCDKVAVYFTVERFCTDLFLYLNQT